MTFLDDFRWAEQVVAASKAAELQRTVPQEPWPTDGTLPMAAHAFLMEDEHGKHVRWTGIAYGVTATVVVVGDFGPLYVRPEFELLSGVLSGVPTVSVSLVDTEGRTWAKVFDPMWTW